MYIALYRKWRPKTFEDVYGQEQITATLKNQLKEDKISHAYLFCGTRGTGKTSTAKLLAKAVNCANPKDNNPCDECESCISINNGNSIDVFEIDAASNRRIDDVRDLRETVKFTPTLGKYKVYIIDEVHMLTNEAFNALLKTLEEPPKHVLFILATTEPHSLPATILSRCQRFDFKRISVDDIVRRLRHICSVEGINIESSALHLIARNSDGAMRDALSILEQCAVYGGRTINHDEVLAILGIANNETLFKMADCIQREDAAEALMLIEEISSGGKDINQFIRDMILHYRNLLMTKVSDSLENIIDMSKESIKLLKEQGNNYTKENIIRCINILSSLENEAKWSSQPRILLEIAVVKMCKLNSDYSTEGLLARLEKLENLASGGQLAESFVQLEKKEQEKKKAEAPISKKLKVKEQVHSGEITKKWSEFMQHLKTLGKIKLRTYFTMSKPVKFEEGNLVLSFSPDGSYCKEALEMPSVKSEAQELLSSFFGEDIKLKCIMEGEFDNVKVDGEDDDIVQRVIEIFGSELVEIVDE